MNSRERILTTLNHEEPDKVPIDSWITPEIAEVLVRGFNLDLKKDPFALPKALGNDLLYLSVGFCDGYSSTLKPERQIGPNLFQCLMVGVHNQFEIMLFTELVTELIHLREFECRIHVQ